MSRTASLSSIILDSKTYPGELFKVTRELYSIFSESTGVSIEEHSEDSTLLKNGAALSPGVAAFCMVDLLRTQRFSQSLLSAIQDKRAKLKERKVNVLYAGCGPYATLLSIIAPFLNSEEVEFTLIDIHQESLDAAKALLNKLEASALVTEYSLEDASSLVLDQSKRPDIVVSETMTAGLMHEPQASIMLNLLRQTPAETIFIPQNVRLFLGGKHIQNNSDHDAAIPPKATEIDCVFDLEESLFKHLHDTPDQEDTESLTGKTIAINKSFDYYVLTTHIDIYKDFKLKPFESSLTINRHLSQVFESGNRIKSKYLMMDPPHLELETIA